MKKKKTNNQEIQEKSVDDNKGLKGWREIALKDVAIINPAEKLSKGKIAKKVAMEVLQPFSKKVPSFSFEPYNGGMKFRNGDTIIARITPCLENGKTAFIDFLDEDEVGFGSTEYIVLREKKDISDKHFLYYFSISPDFREVAILSMTGSSGRQRVQIDVVSNHKFLLPPLPEQRAIASVLSCLDDKIDLLHCQNKTLEAMAETLFRQWFIEPCKNGLPEGWEEKKLGECVDIGIGRTPPRQEFHWFTKSPIGIKWISIKDLGNNGVYIFTTDENLTHEAVEKFKIPIIPKDTVVLSFKMTVGRVSITSEDMVSNEAIAHFKFNQETPFSLEYLYLFLKFYQYDALGSTSSIVTAINSNMIKQIEIVIPEITIMSQFNHIATRLFKKIRENQIQLRTLEKLRDLLLPKLISGEIRVKYE